MEITTNSFTAENTYSLRPHISKKFKSSLLNERLSAILKEELADKHYDKNLAGEWAKSLSESIRDIVKSMEFDRYKFLVHVVIGESRGGGVKIGARCMWDSDTDNAAYVYYMNHSLFSVAMVFGVYFY